MGALVLGLLRWEAHRRLELPGSAPRAAALHAGVDRGAVKSVPATPEPSRSRLPGAGAALEPAPGLRVERPVLIERAPALLGV